MNWTEIIFYIDGAIIFALTIKEHNRILIKFLSRCVSPSTKFAPHVTDKCSFQPGTKSRSNDKYSHFHPKPKLTIMV